MRHGRTIAIKHPSLRNLRNNIRLSYSGYIRKEERESHKLPFTDGKKKISELNKLRSFMSDSICKCPGCDSMVDDMTYSARDNIWYCTECFKLYHLEDLPLTKPQVRKFLRILAGPEACQYNDREWRCGGKEFVYARKILNQMGITKKNQGKFLETCKKLGGHCDCEILMNAAPLLLGEQTPW